jgi:hypothetical protein
MKEILGRWIHSATVAAKIDVLVRGLDGRFFLLFTKIFRVFGHLDLKIYKLNFSAL